MRRAWIWGLAVSLMTGAASAETPPEAWRVDFGMTLSRFEQQVKTEIGGARGERLVEETNVGLALLGTYRVWGPLSLGLYTQFDTGVRRNARFEAFDADGKATTVDETGGAFREVWLGPLVRLQYKAVFFEAAYGALGIRWDDARDDLPADGGDTDSALLTSPAVSWYVALGGGVPVIEHLDLVFRLEYRVRYYDRRSGGDFEPALSHGTQNLTPFVGLAWLP